jgi:hypothetical protein
MGIYISRPRTSIPPTKTGWGVWQYFPRSKKLFGETGDLFFCSAQAKFYVSFGGMYSPALPSRGSLSLSTKKTCPRLPWRISFFRYWRWFNKNSANFMLSKITVPQHSIHFLFYGVRRRRRRHTVVSEVTASRDCSLMDVLLYHATINISILERWNTRKLIICISWTQIRVNSEARGLFQKE